MHGPLSEIGLIEVLQLLERGRRSGRLRIVGPTNDSPRTVRIRDGVIVALEPDSDDRAVTKALIHRGEVAPVGDDEAEPIPESHRQDVRERLARLALGKMLHWEQGRFDFEAGPVPDGPLAWSTDMLVLDLVATESQRAELQDELGDWQLVVERAPIDQLRTGGPVSLEAIDWRILDGIDGHRDIARLAAHLREPLEEIGSRLRVLQAAAIIQLRAPEQERRELGGVTARLPDPSPSIDHLMSHLGQTPSDGSAWRSLGLAEVGAGRFDRAVTVWQSWQRAVPSDAGAAQALIDAAQTMMEAMRDSRE